mmetsp:Transcript_54130/g.150585  ORF Transcript_54130/g.150585 Transcript_54130/m.150585 type:complete len:284 (-) Transcript_54130:675-1526(-)
MFNSMTRMRRPEMITRSPTSKGRTRRMRVRDSKASRINGPKMKDTATSTEDKVHQSVKSTSGQWMDKTSAAALKTCTSCKTDRKSAKIVLYSQMQETRSLVSLRVCKTQCTNVSSLIPPPSSQSFQSHAPVPPSPSPQSHAHARSASACGNNSWIFFIRSNGCEALLRAGDVDSPTAPPLVSPQAAPALSNWPVSCRNNSNACLSSSSRVDAAAGESSFFCITFCCERMRSAQWRSKSQIPCASGKTGTSEPGFPSCSLSIRARSHALCSTRSPHRIFNKRVE